MFTSTAERTSNGVTHFTLFRVYVDLLSYFLKGYQHSLSVTINLFTINLFICYDVVLAGLATIRFYKIQNTSSLTPTVGFRNGNEIGFSAILKVHI